MDDGITHIHENPIRICFVKVHLRRDVMINGDDYVHGRMRVDHSSRLDNASLIFDHFAKIHQHRSCRELDIVTIQLAAASAAIHR